MAIADLIAAIRELQEAYERLEHSKKRKTDTQALLADIQVEIDTAQADLARAKTTAKTRAASEL